MLRQIGSGEIVVIVVVLLLLFGASKLPDLARSIGASAREFRKGLSESEGTIFDSPEDTIFDSQEDQEG